MDFKFIVDDKKYYAIVIFQIELNNKSVITVKGLNEIADYIMQKYQGYKIRGVYEPGQLSTDRINNIIRDEEELKNRADNFYRAMGYKKIGYEDFRKHPERYSGIDENLDFQLGEEISKIIIVKDIIPKLKYPFRVINGVLVNQNALEREIDMEGER